MANTRSTKNYSNLTKQEELEIFRAASKRIVERARKDRIYALRFLREIGHFAMNPEQDTGEDLVALSRRTSKTKPGKPAAKRAGAK